MSTNNGGPAFPFPSVWDERRGEVTQYGSEGMALRDYFAAKAMQELVRRGAPMFDSDMPGVAAMSYRMADAMIEAREAK